MQGGFTFNLLYLHMKVASSILCCLWCRLYNCSLENNQTFTMIILLSLRCLTILIYGIVHCTCVSWGEGGLNFCHFGAYILLLNDPFRLVVFILNEAGFVTFTFSSRKSNFISLVQKLSDR